MSPYYWAGGNADVFFVSNHGYYRGYLGSTNVPNTNVVRPVVSLKAEVEVTGGDGNANNPYIVTLP